MLYRRRHTGAAPYDDTLRAEQLAQPPGPRSRFHNSESLTAAPAAAAVCSRRCREALPQPAGNLGLAWPPVRPILSLAFGVDARYVSGAVSLVLRPMVRLGRGAFFGPPVGDRRLSRLARPRRIPFGRLTPLPTPPPNALRPARPSAPRSASTVREADSPLRVAVRCAHRLPGCLSDPTAPVTPLAPAPRDVSPKVLTVFKLIYCGSSRPREVPWAAVRLTCPNAIRKAASPPICSALSGQPGWNSTPPCHGPR